MSELKPMLEETKDATERALLREARDYAAGPETRRRTLEALGVSGPSPVPWLHRFGWKLMLGVVALGGAGGLYLLKRTPAPAPASPSPTAAAPALPPAITTTAPTAPTARTPAAPPPAATTTRPQDPAGPAAVAPSPRRAASTHAASPRPSASSSTLAEEIAAIDQARQALYANDKEATLRALDDYDRRFPAGTLAPESRKLRARADALR